MCKNTNLIIISYMRISTERRGEQVCLTRRKILIWNICERDR